MSDIKLVSRLYRKIWKLRAELREQNRINDEMLTTIIRLQADLVREREDRLFGDLAKSSPLTRPANQ